MREHEWFGHFLIQQCEMDFQIYGDIEKIKMAFACPCDMQHDTMPYLMGEDKQTLFLCQFCIEVDIDENAIAVCGSSAQAVIADGDQFHTHDDAADEWPLDEKLLTVLRKLFQTNIFSLFFFLVGCSYVESFLFQCSSLRDQ